MRVLSRPKIIMKSLSTKQVAIRIAVIISSVEFLIMLILRVIPHEVAAYSEATLDTALLVMLSTPAIYIWVIKPFVDIRDEALAQISHLALTDPLTQLANRRLISKHLGKIMAGSARHKDHGAVLLIDLDRFKSVNDSYGHEAGDAMLVETAARLRSIVRSEDVVGRLGGDEFVVLISRLGADDRLARDMALRVAENLINVISKPFDFKGGALRVGASIGIRLLGFEELDTETVMNEADIAMYRAKEAGRGCAVFFEK
ncbi:MAG: GGDEF domain-containing protein [Gammaproteobacteria bacterium]|nr:GGDEF domain-containing protein [Gammaproteobacteria bacterium]